MKKVLLSIFAVAALASCFQNEELVGVGGDKPIAFDNAYVGNATKAIDNSFNNENLEEFQVYGTVTANGSTANIFNGVDVSKATGVWKYADEHTQYWMAGNDYSFKAVVAGNEAGATQVVLGQYDMPTAINVLDASKQKDVLYDEVLGVNYHNTLEPVKFTFEHLLAKAKVTVKETAKIENGGYYVVTDVYLKNTHKTATYTIGTGWAGYVDAYNLEFGNIVDVNADENTPAAALELPLGTGAKGASHYERLIIPQNDCELTVVVSYQYYNNGIAQKTVENQEIKTIANIEAGKAYNFVLTLAEPGEKIEFDVEDVTEWDEYPVYEGKTVYAAGVAEFVDAIEKSDATAVVLTEDIDLNTRATIGLTIARDLILDGNGHKIVSAHDRAINVSGAENVTIKNLVIEATGERAINLIQGAKKVTIEDVTAVAANYTVNVAGSAPDANVTISNSHLTGLNTVNIAGANAVVTINDSTIICNDQSESENYAAIAMNNNATNAVVTVNGGEIIVNGDSYAGSVGSNDASLVLNGTETHGATISIVSFAIMYGDYYNSYSTLAEAIEMVKAGETIVLIRDVTDAEPVTIPAGKTVVLDLKGHTISGVDTSTASAALITNKGNLTVVGPGKLQLSATNDRDWNAYSSVISNTVGGNLVVDGGVVIEHLGGTDMAYGIDNLTNGKGTSAVVTVKKATVKSTYRAIRQFLNGVEATNELYVKAGAVVEGANKSIWMQDPSANANTGKLVVEAGAQLKGDVYLYVCAGSTTWPVEVSIASAALVGESKVLTGNVPAGYVVVEENGAWVVASGAVANTSEQLAEVIENGATIILAEGTFVLPTKAQGKTLTFIGAGDPANTVIATNTSGSYEGCNYALDGSTVVFKNISITTDNNTYTGYARCKATFENCIINNCLTLYDSCSFVDCTLNVSGDQYNVWTWGAPIATFENCVFNSDGKAMLLYGQANTHLTINNCTFNDSGVLPDLKAAIEIGNDYNTSYNLVVNNTVVNGYEINDKGINTGTTLWANKNSMGQDKLNVVVDGVDVY
ncbi:MAG: fimbrillin family protein [Alistipes sp.]|nr:fimbrillin family protein [Alistipes sp.]